jgi:acyl-coenzyme A synthetase/AMP-(fatty) acid ligase
VSTTEVEKVLNTFPQVSESMVYGVAMPGTDGRIGMASVIPKSVKLNDFNFKELTSYFQENLPGYAIPKFIRFKNKLESTSTYKTKKVNAKKEGFDPNNINDPLFVLLPMDEGYKPLTADIYNDILNGRYRF